MAGALDVIKVVARMAMLGQEILNVYHFISSDPVFDADVLDDLAQFMDDVYDTIDGVLVDNLSFVDLSITNETDGTDIGVVGWPALTVGAVGADMAPTGIAGLVTLPTAFLGTRGRKFIPGISESNITDSVIIGAMVAFLQDYGDLLIAPFLGATSGEPWQYVVVDKDGFARVPTEAIVANIPAYQRRRKVGVGI